MADGYARATGGVGVAIATSGPGATNMVTGIATAMMDSSPIVCITGQVGSKLIGSDAFQETDITGVTLPITKHNYLVTHAQRTRAHDARGLLSGPSGRPGPVLVDITKDAQQSTCEFDWEAAKPQLPRLPAGSLANFTIRITRKRLEADSTRSQAPRDSRRARHHSFRRDARSARTGGAHRHSRHPDAARPRSLPRLAPAESRHDGHARRSLGEPHRSRKPTC